MNAKRVLLSVLVLVTMGAAVPVTTSAHTLESDGGIGGVLHIQPDDNPIAGVQTSMNIAIKDGAGKFKAQDCNCNYEFKLGDTVAATKVANGTATSYLFPEPGVYNITLRGQPKAGASFQQFSLSFVVRVEQSAVGSTAYGSQNIYRLVLFAVLVTGIVGGVLVFSTRKKARVTK